MLDTSEPRAVLRVELALLAVVVAGAGLVHGLTIREGQGWLDDWASYVAHARNIAEDLPYADTGYVYNQANPVAGPRAYPPVYPMILAPVYATGGLDLDAMKLQVVLILLALLVAVWALVRRWHPPWMALSAAAAFGFSPFMNGFKDNVLSDIPFALFAVVAILLIDLAERAPAPQPWRYGGAIGLAAWLAYGTRTVGLMLLVAMLVHLALRHGRRIPLYAWVATGTFAVMAGVQGAVVPGGSGYTDQLALVTPRLIANNAWRYLRSLEGLTVNGYVSTAGTILLVVVTALALIGYATKLPRERRTVVEVLVPLYVAAIAAWPAFQSLRFLIVLLPFYALYALLGAVWLGEQLGVRRVAVAMLGLVVGLSYLGVYVRLTYEPVADGPTTPAAQDAFDWVRENTDPTDLLLFLRPKALALYTGRRSATIGLGWDEQRIADYAGKVGARYLVDGPVDPGTFTGIRGARVVYTNGEFTILLVP